MKRVHVRAALALSILFAAGGAEAQFVQYTPPGDYTSPSEAREASLDRAMQEARWRFGRLFAHPWLAVRDLSYQDNVTSGGQEPPVSDLTVSIGAGINTYLPLGSDWVWSTFLLPEYAWWRDLDERSRLNGRYGTGLFGNFGRLGIEIQGERFDESKTFSREVEERTNQRSDRGSLELTVDLGKGWLLFAEGSEHRLRSLEEEPVFDRLASLDRDERLARVGVGLDLGSGLRLGLGYEESEVEFEPSEVDRSNSGSSIVLEIDFDGRLFDVAGNVAERSIEPDPGAAFVAFDDTTGSLSLGWRAFGPVHVELFGSRDLVYSIQSDVSYFEEDRVGLGLRTSLGSRGGLRLFVEEGENVFVTSEPAAIQRIDERESHGASLSFQLGQVSFEIGATRTEYVSNIPQFDREFTRVTTSIRLGTERLSPWG